MSPAGARRLALATLAALSGAARAEPFPTRGGETGLLDVPDAETAGVRGGLVGIELRFDRLVGGPSEVGPLPLSAVTGILPRLDVGFAMREWGRPGDPYPSPVLFSANLKLRILDGTGWRPSVAVELVGNRFNERGFAEGRVIASTAEVGRIRLAGYLGGSLHGPRPLSPGPTGGLALALRHRSDLETILEATGSSEGALVGAALRWSPVQQTGVSLGLSWLPREKGFRVSLGLGVGVSPLAPARRMVLPPPPVVAPPPAPPPAPVFPDDRPRFRMRIKPIEIPGTQSRRHLQIGPVPVQPAAEAEKPKAAAPPSPDEARRARLRERAGALDAREKRLVAAASDLAAREQKLAARMASLDERERLLSALQEQLLARERQLGRSAPATPEEKALDAREKTQLEAEVRLGGQERRLAATAGAASKREQAAAAREAGLRAEGDRLAAAAAREKSPSRADDLTASHLASRERLLATREGRQQAWRERLDAMEGAQQLRADRLEMRQTRLDALRQRLDLVAGRIGAPRAPAAAPKAGARPAARPSFIVVVQPPASIVKLPRAAPAAATGAAAGAALHPGVAVEKAVAAATVVYFRTPDATLGELDREAVQGVARLAARERCELLVWARAQSPAQMGEAARRAEELKHVAAKAADVDPAQVVTRITVRPAATGVDVVVSALREQAAPAAAAAGAGAPASEMLREGETGRRQVRDVLVRQQASIEACVNSELTRRSPLPKPGVVKLTVEPDGSVSGLRATSAELAGGELEKCLRTAAAAWKLPPSDSAYEVEVPITMVGAGGAK